MLGAAGALLCLACGMAAGSWMRERRLARWRMLSAWMEAISGMRVLLEQERPSLPELLQSAAECISSETGAQQAAQRLKHTAHSIASQPLLSVADAYASACCKITAPWEKQEERAAVERLFRQLGSGTAAMREQAAAACLRRLKPLEEHARTEAEKGGRLCMQLGMLLGLMAGIALW